MESQKPKIAMYVKRSFGDKMNASFDFIKENWKPLLKYSTYLVLPVCLLQALNLNGLMGSMMDVNMLQNMEAGITTGDMLSQGGMLLAHYAGVIFFSFIASLLLTSLVYALIKAYSASEDRLQNITMSALKPLLFQNMKRIFVMGVLLTLLFIVVFFIIGALAAASLYTAILTVPLLIAFALPLALLTPIYLFEDITFWQAFRKTYRLGFATWGGILLVILAMGLIAYILQIVVAIPWYIAFVVKMVFTMSDAGSEATVSVGYSFMQYLLSILLLFGTYLSAIFTLVGLAYQYGHASEVVDSVTVENDIDNFDKL